MSHPIVVGGTDQSLIMVAIDTSDNSFKTDLVAADITSLVVTRTGSTDVSIASPADKSNPNDAHSDGGVFNDGSGQYIVDITDDTVASYYPSLRLQGAWTDSGAGTSGLLIGLVHPMTVNSPNQDIPTAAENRIEMDDNSTRLTAIAIASTTAANEATSANSGVTTLGNRIGAWAGSGRNTILGAFQALFRKDADATVPSDINADLGSGSGTADNTTDSLEAIADVGGGGSTVNVTTEATNIISENS